MAEQKQLQELQMVEQNMQQIAMQKQNLQMQLAEIESAQKELEGRTSAYKIVGNLLVESDVAALNEELKSKKEVVELRLKTYERQESKLKDRMAELQKSVLGQ